jgi:hypothetical protein
LAAKVIKYIQYWKYFETKTIKTLSLQRVRKKVLKILAYIGSIHYLCCKKEEPACWRGKLEEKPGQAQAGYQSSQLRCKL